MDKSLDAFHQTPNLPPLAHIGASRPLHWIQLGWQDFTAHPGPSLAHAAILVAMGWLLLLLCSGQLDLLAAAVSGFLLIGPVMAAGFYALSRLRAAGEAPSFDASVEAAVRNARPLAQLGSLLAAMAIAWVVVSRLLFVQGYGGAVPAASETFYRTALEWHDYTFLGTYLVTGAVFALAAFVVSAIAAPMIFDRATDLRTAVFTSIRAVAVNPLPMAIWALLIAGLTALGFATFLLGLLVVLPLLGHATWHAYLDLTR